MVRHLYKNKELKIIIIFQEKDKKMKAEAQRTQRTEENKNGK